MTTDPLSSRVAIVTGGGRGLGRAIAHGLAGVGFRVLATAAREHDEIDEIDAVAEEAGQTYVNGPVLMARQAATA